MKRWKDIYICWSSWVRLFCSFDILNLSTNGHMAIRQKCFFVSENMHYFIIYVSSGVCQKYQTLSTFREKPASVVHYLPHSPLDTWGQQRWRGRLWGKSFASVRATHHPCGPWHLSLRRKNESIYSSTMSKPHKREHWSIPPSLTVHIILDS